MRTGSVAHYCAALAVAQLNGALVRWHHGVAQYSPEPTGAPELDALQLTPCDDPLLVPQGRRHPLKGARRALELLRDMPHREREDEFAWLWRGERDARRVHAHKRLGGKWDTYAMGRLIPACIGGPPISGWLAVLAYHGARSVLFSGRQKWKAQSAHPDCYNAFLCWQPHHWTTTEVINSFYFGHFNPSQRADIVVYELRTVAGELPSYCEQIVRPPEIGVEMKPAAAVIL